MSTILGGGEMPLKAGKIESDNAFPIPITFVDGNGVVVGIAVGGLTKRQELAARFLAAMMTKVYDPNGHEPISLHETITRALRLADDLLAATEPKTP